MAALFNVSKMMQLLYIWATNFNQKLFPLRKLVRMRGPKHIREASEESKASKVSKARK